jgi:uncharacterized protein
VTESSTKPLPVPDERSEGYWASTARHVLAIARCSHCHTYVHPPGVVCRNCSSTEPNFVFEAVSGRGVIRSWTVMREAFVSGFEHEVPFVIVDVELEEQADLRVLAHLVDGPDAPIAAGAAVMVVFEDRAPGISIPAFRLVATS